MCVRYASTTAPIELMRRFQATGDVPHFQPSWNLAPTQSGLVLRRHPRTGERVLGPLQWGLVPGWTKPIRPAHRPINARADMIESNAYFRAALAQRRCLVPADLFYEWRETPEGRHPYAIARTDGTPMALAGLWETWRDPDGQIVQTYAVVTTPANAEMSALHEWMPLILDPRDWPAWLGEVDADPLALLRPAPDGILRYWPVSAAVTSVRNNAPELIDPVATGADGVAVWMP